MMVAEATRLNLQLKSARETIIKAKTESDEPASPKNLRRLVDQKQVFETSANALKDVHRRIGELQQGLETKKAALSQDFEKWTERLEEIAKGKDNRPKDAVSDGSTAASTPATTPTKANEQPQPAIVGRESNCFSGCFSMIRA